MSLPAPDSDSNGSREEAKSSALDVKSCVRSAAEAAAGAPLPQRRPRTERRNLGRSARRRRKKWLEIERAERQLLASSKSDVKSEERTESTATSSLPTDRQIEWPWIEQLRQQEERDWKSPQDDTALLSQLGYVPGNVFRVAARISDLPSALKTRLLAAAIPGDGPSTPVVIQLYPLALRDEFAGGKANGRKFKSRKRKRSSAPSAAVPTSNDGNREGDEHAGNAGEQGGTTESSEIEEQQPAGPTASAFVVEPFPTIYWLTHPLLRIWISRLEVQGLGVELEERLQREPDSLERMQRAHAAYGEERIRILSFTATNDKNDDDPGHKTTTILAADLERWKAVLHAKRGISGICNPAAVKCLHAHLAHCLSGGPGSRDNVVGLWVVEQALVSGATAMKKGV